MLCDVALSSVGAVTPGRAIYCHRHRSTAELAQSIEDYIFCSVSFLLVVLINTVLFCFGEIVGKNLLLGFLLGLGCDDFALLGTDLGDKHRVNVG